ncbi:MAG: TetR family transcriptional regulator C-terminal domain-containing protein, partial [Thiohalobacteraceae bacterium]
RNPRVGEAVRSADRQCRESLAQTIRSIRGAQGHEDTDAVVAGMVEVLAAMFQGLLIRGVRNPTLDREGVVQTFRRVIHSLLMQPMKD